MKEMIGEIDMDKVWNEFERMTKEAEKVQKETLKRILEENASAEYLQSLGLNGRTDPESYKALVPVVEHKDLKSYIDRIVDGDVSLSILTTKPITTTSLSSGTTGGMQKFIPWNDELWETTAELYKTAFAYRNREFPIERGGKALNFIYSSKTFKTKGGVIAGTATTNVVSHPKYKATMEALNIPPCSPDEVIFSPDYQQSLYCHLLCGLIFREEIQIIWATFAHSLVSAFRTFEQVYEDLCNDIKEGVLSSKITVPSIREAMSKLLKPNPELASLIHKKCKGLTNWYGLLPELFPNAKYICGILTGAMEPYVNKLRHYAGELPLVTTDYGASEGWLGTNLTPRVPLEFTTYTVLPHIGYYEFIPLNDSNPVGLTEVKVGEEYELVVTNPTGLYRYRLGDVVKVMGFHNSSPKLKFIRRTNLLLTINIDKNTEIDLHLAVETGAKFLADEKLEVVDYTSYIDLSEEPGHYVIFLELSGESASEEALGECCNAMDKSFVDQGYISSRKVKAIEALEVRVVKKGTFQKILDYRVGLGTSVSQYKTLRCVGPNNTKILQILCDNVVKNCFSTAYN